MSQEKKQRKKRTKAYKPQPDSYPRQHAVETEQSLVAYDENLLERARIQWQFGDWSSLASIERTSLQHHPDRAKLALLAAAGHLQLGQNMEGRQLVRLAQDWGIDARLCAQILVGGVYNSLARAFSIAGREERALQHFEQAVYLGNPGATLELLAQARSQQQLQQLNKRQQNLLATQTQTSKHIPNTNTPHEPANQQDKPAKYLCSIKLELDNGQVIALGLNTESKNSIAVQEGALKYQAADNNAIYLVSSEYGSFERPSTKPQFQLATDKRYVLSGQLVHEGDNRPGIWFFQYADGKRIHSQNVTAENGKFSFELDLKEMMESVAIGIRVSGCGCLKLHDSVIYCTEQNSSAENSKILHRAAQRLGNEAIVFHHMSLLQEQINSVDKNCTNIVALTKIDCQEKELVFAHFDKDYIPSVMKKNNDFYESSFLQALSLLHVQGKYIVDCGANIGNHSVFFASVMNADVISFEPQPYNYAFLQANIALNSLQGKVHALNLAVGEREGEVALKLVMENNHGAYSAKAIESVTGNSASNADLFDVRVTSMDAALNDIKDRISIIKLDIEGMELEALKGAVSILESSMPVVAVECFTKTLLHEISMFLEPFGYFVLESMNATPTFIFISKNNIEHQRSMQEYLRFRSVEQFARNKKFQEA